MTNSRTWYRFRNQANRRLEIAIYDEIGFWGYTAKDFYNSLKGAGDIEEIDLRINSPGGEVFDAIAIYNILRRLPAPVNAYVDGIAASAASIVLMAGDTARMPRNTMLFLHDPSGVVIGDADDMRSIAEALDRVKDSIVSSYEDKTGLSRDKISDIMKNETWLGAEEALDLGFADEILDAVEIKANFDARRFRGVPRDLAREWRNAMPKPQQDQKKPSPDETTREDAGAPAEVSQPPAQPEVPKEKQPGAPEGGGTQETENPNDAPVTPAADPGQPAPGEGGPVIGTDDMTRVKDDARREALGIVSACTQGGLPHLASAFLARNSTLSEVSMRLENCAAIQMAAEAAGYPSLGETLVTKYAQGKITVQEARNQILNARAGDDGLEIDSKVVPGQESEKPQRTLNVTAHYRKRLEARQGRRA